MSILHAQQPTLKGFGMEFDLVTGTSRHWYFSNGEKRWVDTDELCDQ